MLVATFMTGCNSLMIKNDDHDTGIPDEGERCFNILSTQGGGR